jgi:rhodanese-related sulfurtransferase
VSAANPLLAAPDEDAFVNRLLAELGSYPPYFLRMRDVNRAGPHLYGPGEPVLPSLGAADVARLMRGGAWVVDARPVSAFAAGHTPGSVSIALRPQFATWLGWAIPHDAAVVAVLEPGQDRGELVRQARNIGCETVLGELNGGIDAWRAAGHAAEAVPIARVEAAVGTVLDVRQASEYAAGHVPGAVNIELGAIRVADVPAGPVSVMCAHGERAMTAASLLTRRGHRRVTALIGGPDDWAAAHSSLATR